jgi:hypothetical protein
VKVPTNPNPRPPDDDSWFPGYKSWLGHQVMLFISDHTPRCNEVVRILSEGMDRKLPLRRRIQLQVHHAMCCYCHRYERQLKDLRKFSNAFPEEIGEASGEVLPADAKARLKRALKAESE